MTCSPALVFRSASTLQARRCMRARRAREPAAGVGAFFALVRPLARSLRRRPPPALPSTRPRPDVHLARPTPLPARPLAGVVVGDDADHLGPAVESARPVDGRDRPRARDGLEQPGFAARRRRRQAPQVVDVLARRPALPVVHPVRRAVFLLCSLRGRREGKLTLGLAFVLPPATPATNPPTTAPGRIPRQGATRPMATTSVRPGCRTTRPTRS